MWLVVRAGRLDGRGAQMLVADVSLIDVLRDVHPFAPVYVAAAAASDGAAVRDKRAN
jgi:hypothetical protein